jgi:hypothetical protein
MYFTQSRKESGERRKGQTGHVERLLKELPAYAEKIYIASES